MWQKLRNNFIAGIAVLLPLVVTVWVLDFLYKLINRSLLLPVTKLFTPYFMNPYLEYVVSVAIFLLFIALIIITGMATRIIFLRRLFSSGEKMFFKIPMVGRIYVAIKQISAAFFSEKKAAARSVVLIEFPRKGMYSLGFLTAKHAGEVEEKTGKKMCNVYVPSVPNPATGFFFLVPEEDIILLKMSIEEATKLVLSGGAVTPDSAGYSGN